jgi:hypothetical protein
MGGADQKTIFAVCEAVIAAGSMCGREAGGIKFDLLRRPGRATYGINVDGAKIRPIAGAQFDGDARTRAGAVSFGSWRD